MEINENNPTSDSSLSSFKTNVALATWSFSHSQKPTIYQVPYSIRNANPEAYKPKVILIGPYNRKTECLTDMEVMESIKLKYLNKFLSRKPGKNRLEEYLIEMKKLENQVRSAYWGKVDMTSDEFAQMILLDGCFIIEFLLQWFLDDDKDEVADTKFEDPVRGIKLARREILADMLLLENQIPFFVIEKLLSFVHPSANLTSLMTLSLFIHCPSMILHPNINLSKDTTKKDPSNDEHIINIINILESSTSNSTNIHHFLHLCHTLMVPKDLHDNIISETDDDDDENNQGALHRWHVLSNVEKFQILSKSQNESSSETTSHTENHPHHLFSVLSSRNSILGDEHKLRDKLQSIVKSLSTKVESSMKNHDRIPTVTHLHDAGIRFEKKENPMSILKVTFENGRMEIPQLHIYENTNSLFHNLTAFEQLYNDHDKIKFPISAYCSFLDLLVDTSDDVAILQNQNIIVNHLGSNEDIALFTNQMRKGFSVNIQKSYLANLFDNVNKYTSQNIHRWRARMNRDYFSHPWAIISFIAGILLMILTVWQTVLGIIQFYRPAN